jgi:hypothetical protein
MIMRMFVVAAVLALMPSLASAGKYDQDMGWISGEYSMSSVVISGAPPYRPEGKSWDPEGGAADLYMIVYTAYEGSDEWQESIVSRYTEDAGTYADLGDYLFYVTGYDYPPPATGWVFFQVLDYDPDLNEIMDESGSIPLYDLSPSGWNTITCENGTTISFQLRWMGGWE